MPILKKPEETFSFLDARLQKLLDRLQKAHEEHARATKSNEIQLSHKAKEHARPTVTDEIQLSHIAEEHAHGTETDEIQLSHKAEEESNEIQLPHKAEEHSRATETDEIQLSHKAEEHARATETDEIQLSHIAEEHAHATETDEEHAHETESNEIQLPHKAEEHSRATETDDEIQLSDKAEEHARATELSSKLGYIKKKLKNMRREFPDIKNWGKTIMEQFFALEQELDDDIFKDSRKKSEVGKKLDVMLEGIENLNDSIRVADKGICELWLKPKDDSMVADHHHQACPQWVNLKIDNEILINNVMSSFSAGFHCLSGSEQVKMCSLCLSVFPQNSVIEKRPLIYWWIGEGLVMKSENKTAEEAGEQVFKELLDEGFIRPSSEDKSLSVSSFIIDPWIHRTLIWIAKNHQFLEFTTEWTPCCGRRRAFLCKGNDGKENDALMNDNNKKDDEDLMMVFNVNEEYLRMKPERLASLKRVEVMQMGRWQNSAEHHIEVQDQALFVSLGSQQHLKYLSLRGISRVETLPDSISKLISLKILDLRACHNLERLPATISKLSNLTHLDVSQCYLLESIPRGVERLTALEVLKGFVIGKMEANSCRITDLSRLKNLRKLSIRVGNQVVKQHGQLGSLKNLNALRILTIWFGHESLAELNTISFPQTLTKLDLRCVPFQEAPDWMLPGKLPPNLEKLYIQGGKLKTLQHLNNERMKVKYLRFNHLQDLKDIPGALPNYIQKSSFYEYSPNPNVASSTPAQAPSRPKEKQPNDLSKRKSFIRRFSSKR